MEDVLELPGAEVVLDIIELEEPVDVWMVTTLDWDSEDEEEEAMG